MASIRWKGITRDVDRHGNVRFYFRVPGKPRVRLRGDPGSEDFALAYFAARNGEPAPTPRQTGPRRGTFGYIVRHYLTSRDFKALDRKLTQRPRERLLEALKKIRDFDDDSEDDDPGYIAKQALASYTGEERKKEEGDND